MPTYMLNPVREPSRKEYATWVAMGFLGDFEFYCSMVRRRNLDMSPIMVHGDLGPHCRTEGCAAPSDNLCDFPVGKNGRTCDRPLCEDHSHEVGQDTHYCEAHYKAWREFTETSLASVLSDRLRPVRIGAAEND